MAISLGIVDWDVSRDELSHREYTVTSRVQALATEGPSAILSAWGLPTIGSIWSFGGVDLWAFCTPKRQVRRDPQYREGEKVRHYLVTDTFSTRPMKRCQDVAIENPLMEPPKISGTFVTQSVEATVDRNGAPIKSSSFERLHGKEVEFKEANPTVSIEQNVLKLDLAFCSSRVLCLNDGNLWGLAKRKIQLANFTWERLVYGVCCYYYKRTFDFEINYKGFDRDVADEGTKVLNGHWDNTTGNWIVDTIRGYTPPEEGGANPDPDNPTHFIRFKDRNGENTKVLLNGRGIPATVPVVTPYGAIEPQQVGRIRIEKYDEVNFLELGIPATIY